MLKLNINSAEIEYDIMDCTDKVVVLKVPMAVTNDELEVIRKTTKHIKETCNAKEVVCIPEYIKFKVRSVDKTLHILNRLITKLNCDKKKLERLKDKNEETVKH